jgi:asparagine synthase (glutamine-hydrolysing)
MCGIAAISSPAGREPHPIGQLLDPIRHRGPDADGTFFANDGSCSLGHVRLAIIDLSAAGIQPMSDATGRFLITYNGEVYNYRELRQRLERAHGPIGWKSDTDTEVILEGVAREGIRFLDHLNGIFALAIYDQRERLLHVLRDPIGIKPLIVTHQNGAAYFCSELKGLLAVSSLRRTLRVRSLAEQAAFMYVPEPHTMFDEFVKVEPGVCLSYRDGALVSRTPLFEHLHSPRRFASKDEAVDALRAEFKRAVERQLTADVPVSLALSGGLDSSAVAWAATQCGGVIRDAYTIQISDEDRRHDAQSDDLRYAERVARMLGIKLNVIPAQADFLSMLPDLVRFMEDGFADPAAINTYLICKGARESGVKVMLTGQGADEYLGGYRRYIAERAIRRTPRPVRELIAIASNGLPERLPGRFNALNRRLRRFGQMAGQSQASRVLGLYTWTSPASVATLFSGHGDIRVGDDLVAMAESWRGPDVVDALMHVDHHYDLMSLNLCYTDRMSMAVGVEARVPFLDFDLIRLMNAIPAEWKVTGREGKHVLKEAMKDHLPRDIVYRDKAGFGLPLRSWMQRSNDLVARYLDANRLQRQGIINGAAVERMLGEQYSGARDHSATLFTLLVQQLWLESSGQL